MKWQVGQAANSAGLLPRCRERWLTGHDAWHPGQRPEEDEQQYDCSRRVAPSWGPTSHAAAREQGRLQTDAQHEN
jgi:hypothetical protein